jgi:hypothetical protein
VGGKEVRLELEGCTSSERFWNRKKWEVRQHEDLPNVASFGADSKAWCVCLLIVSSSEAKL